MTGEGQSGAAYLKISFTLVSMQQEMYKDALYFFGEAKKIISSKEHDLFSAWRFLRAVIMFSFAAIEACINQFIRGYVDSHRNTLGPKEIGKWTERRRYLSITEKLLEGTRLFSQDHFDKNSHLWHDFLELKAWRDALVRFKDFGATKKSIAYQKPEQFLSAAEKAIKTAREVIKKIYLANSENKGSYPSTFDELPR